MAAPNPNIYATQETVVGIAKETVRGTAVAPLYWEKTRSPAYKPDLTLLTDDSLQGNMAEVQDLVAGMRYDAHGWDTYPYLDIFPNHVEAELGSPDLLSTAPAATTLSAATTVGAVTFDTTVALTAPSWVQIGSGANLEVAYVLSVATTTATPEFPLLKAHNSGDAVVGLTGHSFSLLNSGGGGNQPPTYTITDFDGEEWRQLTAAQMDKLTLKFTVTGLVDETVSWFANAATTPTAPTPSESDIEAPAAWTTRVLFNGGVIENWSDVTLDLARQVKAVPGLAGSQAYYTYFADALQCTGSVNAIETFGAPELAAYLAAEKVPVTFLLTDPAGNGLRIHSTNFIFKTGSLERSKQWPTANMDFQLLPSAADATSNGGGRSPLLVSIGNAQATAY